MMVVDNIHSFSVADYVVFAITVVISIFIGLYYALSGGRQRTTEEYLVGNRKMSVVPVALSLMVSFESSIMMLGYPAEIYVYGAQFWLTVVGFAIAIVLGVRIVVPLFHPLRITSAYEVSFYSFGFCIHPYSNFKIIFIYTIFHLKYCSNESN